MKVGLIARGVDRGLGTLTREFARFMEPERTLIVHPDSARDAGLQCHHEWFDPAALYTPWFQTLDERQCRQFLDGLDVVYSAETFYDWRFCDWARDLGVRTVCHAMPEYWPFHAHPKWPCPDVVWAPTAWRLHRLPPRTEVVPVPVALDRFPPRPGEREPGPVRWLHVVGSIAASDRNGTRVFLEAAKHLTVEQTLVVRSQGDPFYPLGGTGRNVHVEVHATDLTDYWELYADADGLVLPRRYGGLSLVAQEAMAAGLALVMPDVEPQLSEWPTIPIRATFENHITTSAGSIPICAPDARDLAGQLDWYASHGGPLRKAQVAAREFAESISWERMVPVYREAFERVLA